MNLINQNVNGGLIVADGRFIKYLDRHGRIGIYVSDIELLAAEYQRRTGNELVWVETDILYFYIITVQKNDTRKLKS